MIFTYHEVNKLPVIVIDKFYSEEACDRIWKELCVLNSTPDKLLPPEKTGSAWDPSEDGKIYLKQNKGVFLDEVYHNRNFSDILRETSKIFEPDICKQLIDRHQFFKYVKNSTADKTLVSYYEESDSYRAHTDCATVSMVSWFFKKPKSFSSGDIVIEDQLTIECVYNRVILFPSILLHAVLPVEIDKDLVGKNFGRYSIAKFISANI